MIKQKPYYLYAGLLDKIESTLPNFQYTLCNNNIYVLIYTDKELKNPYWRVEETVKLLPEERQWLLETKIKINVEAMQDNNAEYIDILDNFCTSLEQELKKESRKK